MVYVLVLWLGITLVVPNLEDTRLEQSMKIYNEEDEHPYICDKLHVFNMY